MVPFTISTALGFALGFLFGVGCAAAVLYTIYLAGYRQALQDAAAGGTGDRFRKETNRLNRSSQA